MNKKKNKKEIDVLELLQSGIGQVYLYMMIGVFPLFYLNNYIDIVSAKRSFLLYLTGCVTCVLLMFGIIRWCTRHGRGTVREHRQISIVDCMVSLFGIAVLLSTLNSMDPGESIWGNSGRRLGAIVMLCCILGYVIASRYASIGNSVIWIFLISSALVFVQEILNNFAIDLLGMKSNLKESQHYYFISTMGNININANFDVLAVAIGAVLFYMSREKVSKVIYSVYVFLGIQAIICSRSDSAILGLLAIMAVLAFFALETAEDWKNYMQLVLVELASLCMLMILKWSMAERMYTFEALQNILTNPWLLFPITAVSAALYYVVNRWKNSERLQSVMHMSRKMGVVILGLGGIILLGTSIWVNCRQDYHGSLDFLRLTDESGNYRGYIWSRTVASYLALPIKDKILGIGLNCFATFIDAGYGEEMRTLYVIPFIDAHNEFLQILCTMGIAGIVGYFGMFVSSIGKASRKENQNREWKILVWVTLVAYLVQGIPNNPQIFTTPLIFIFVGVLENVRRKNQLQYSL